MLKCHTGRDDLGRGASFSRPFDDLQISRDDAETLGHALSNTVTWMSILSYSERRKCL
jgi:hypothetical protein